ncbi:MAG: peptidoglycan DD-metalloendopeptidase family protein [Gaiellaceae bacterium]
MRRGVLLLGLGILAAAAGAASARADGTTTGATTTTTTPSYARLSPSYLPSGCVGAGAAAIADPGGKVLALGTPAADRGPSAYPASSPLVAFGSSSVSGGSTCASASVTLGSVSLLGGLVTADSVSATDGKGTVSGLEVGGSAVTATPGREVLVGNFGELTIGKTLGRLTAPLVLQFISGHGSLPAGTTIVVAFAASAQQPAQKPKARHHAKAPQPSTTTTKRDGGTPTAGGSQNQTGPAPATKKHRHKKHNVPQPLQAKPSLGYRPKHYAFPVDGGASYGDSYGANRSDIYDGWHHGDDLFAPLGTPVVAVANGALSLVGWNRVGGWRLWLTDNKGNSFYYAHLAGYSRWILDHPHVRAGQVVGFLGRTGDAFTTDPHLHFEVHPHQYLGRGYDGAVDPTTYLGKWKVVHVPDSEIPRPAKLKAPVGTPRQEATVVWHELLAARHLLDTKSLAGSAAGDAAGPLHPFPQLRVLDAPGFPPPRIAVVQQTAAHVSAPASMAAWLGGGISGAAVLVALSAGAFTVRRRRRTGDEASN